MFGIHDLPVFVFSGLLLNFYPGPDSLLVINKTLSHGFKGGFFATLGIGTGTLVHILASALGITVILASSEVGFEVVKLLGGTYLILNGSLALLGISKKPSTNYESESNNQLCFHKIFLQGFFTNALNPKVILFFLSFVPQFIDPESQNKSSAFIILGLIFNFNGMIWCNLLAYTISISRKKIDISQRTLSFADKIIGVMFIGFGIKLISQKFVTH